MKCILIVFEGDRPPPPRNGQHDLISSGVKVIPYGKSAYVVGVEDKTIDDVVKLFKLCGRNQPAAMVVELTTYRGCAEKSSDADRISQLLHG